MIPRIRQIGRCFAALLFFAVWYVASNRCAFGLMPVSQKTGEHASCCSQRGGKDKPQKTPSNVCCKTLQGLPQEAKDLASMQLSCVSADVWATLATIALPAKKPAIVLNLDTGPPEARSFAELVLSRSLRSHAPPSLA